MQWLVVVVALVPAVAFAEPESASERESPLSHPAVAIDGGVVGFIDNDLRALVRPGEVWGARVVFGSHEDIRIEVTYAGSHQALDPTAGEGLVSHGTRGVLRINVAPWLNTVEPFLYFGTGWSRYHVQGRMPGSPLQTNDNVLEIPFGIGVAKRIGGFSLDVRAGLEVASGGDLLPIPMPPHSSRTSASMDRYLAAAVFGYEI
ncbi:MAG: hypothetical protein HOV81_26340 [Kofleriaceae bacterium]|nr:hypothetical protein [Kofleriaceae bacterium]